MFQLVLPVLKSKDELRDSRIHELTEELERKSEEIRLAESETVRREKIADVLGDVNELLGHIQKIREAEHMFRQGIITSIVTKFDEFRSAAILKIAYLSNPGWLRDSDRKLTYKELLSN